MTRPIVAASFLAGITAAGLAGRTFARRWFTAASQVEQAPLPYLPPRVLPSHPSVANPVGYGESVGRLVISDDEWKAFADALDLGPSAADRAMPEGGL